MKIVLTGATGYIGGRLAPILLDAGHQVSVIVRDDSLIHSFDWSNQLHKIIIADLLSEDFYWRKLLEEYDVAYYLVHSMYAGKDFSNLDKIAAQNFCKSFSKLNKIIYLGGLLPREKDMSASNEASEHLESRAITGDVLRNYFPVTEFRAGPIIGAGSASFEMIRYLTERIPIMVTPKWVKNIVQPVSIRDVLAYLLLAADMDPLGVVEIGSNRLSFKEVMIQYARKRNLKRIIIPLPVLTPKLAALWVGLVTPIPNKLAIPLISGIVKNLTADLSKAKELFPSIQPLDYSQSLDIALKNDQDSLTPTHWSMSLPSSANYEFRDWAGLLQEKQRLETKATPEALFKVINSIGGESGWFTWGWAWKIRGFIDQLVGGPGLIRGRRKGSKLIKGEVIDFWRIEKIVENSELLLRAEMKIPGKAWLGFSIIKENGKTVFLQTASFEPHGFWGIFYWYAMYPAHRFIFPQMIKKIVEQAEFLSEHLKD